MFCPGQNPALAALGGSGGSGGSCGAESACEAFCRTMEGCSLHALHHLDGPGDLPLEPRRAARARERAGPAIAQDGAYRGLLPVVAHDHAGTAATPRLPPAIATGGVQVLLVVVAPGARLLARPLRVIEC